MRVSESMRACWEGITKAFFKQEETQEPSAEPVAEQVEESEHSTSIVNRMEEIQKALERRTSANCNVDLSAAETVSDAELSKLLNACARQMSAQKKNDEMKNNQ